jgi:Flp pilus assembly protein TadG
MSRNVSPRRPVVPWFARLGRRGAVSIIFACSLLTLLSAVGVGINMSQLAAGRAALQRAVDNAALSGAAAYSQNAASFNALAITMATSVFCNATSALPSGAAIVAQTNAQTCGGNAGPTVTAVTDSYIIGTPGISRGAGVDCAGTSLPAAPYNCGFIVTVSASASLNGFMAGIFGNLLTVSATGMAANPFISFSNIFSIPGGVLSSAKYANSLWVYALLLNADGSINYTANAGGLPDTSSCTGGPDQVTCGAYTMLASTMYKDMGVGYTPPGQTIIYDNGIVRNPSSPTQITATTPLGFAFRGIAGGNYVQYSPPGVYGYQETPPGYSTGKYVYAPNGCIYPYNNLVYNTVGQVWQTVTTTTNGVTTTSYTPMLPWTLVTHWFYSSYLTQNLPPSQGEIAAQSANNELIPSVINDPAQSGANIAGSPTYVANPSPAVATKCPSTTTVGGVTLSNNKFQTTTYITSGNTNCSLYVVASATPGSATPNPAYTGSCFNPANTPGKQYGAMSCQSFGSNYYTFFWNDMGGAQIDNDNYGDGIVQINCASASHVLLIQ